MTRTAAVPRLSGPGELVAALPVLCGFPPRESLVLVCLDGAGPRVGLVARYDLPPEHAEAALLDDVRRRLATAGAEQAYAVLVTDEPDDDDGLPRAGFAAQLQDAAGVDLLDLLLVRDRRWWSYRCDDAACCPPEGTAVPEQTPTLTLVQAESALRGRAVLPSREALVRSLAPPALPALRLPVLEAAALELAAEVLDRGRTAVRQRLRGLLQAALDAGVAPLEQDCAELALALHDLPLRDEVLTWGLEQDDALLAVLLGVAAQTPAPYDAPVCACVAWLAHSRGDGATAGVAVERALATDPEHGLARLLDDALQAQVEPRQLRAVMARTAQVLRQGENRVSRRRRRR